MADKNTEKAKRLLRRKSLLRRDGSLPRGHAQSRAKRDDDRRQRSHRGCVPRAVVVLGGDFLVQSQGRRECVSTRLSRR